MIRIGKTISTILISLSVLSFFDTSMAGPTVIQDSRVTNLSTTPVLGRGYSLATNTYQSICLKGILMTEPSYDFAYSYQEMDSFLRENSKETDTLTKLASKAFRRYLFQKVFESSKRSVLTKATRVKTKTTKRIVVTIDLHSYYASVDESGSRISDTAAQLLLNRDIPGFFNSCGSYYIRSISRKAQFVSVFEFEAKSEKKDKEFIYQLETEIKSFRRVLSSLNGLSNERDGAQSKNKIPGKKDSFSRNASSRNLTITASAFGLGKNENATLISYDIESFKTAIKTAFLSMQNPRTGKVDSIEVVPWVENTEFQNLIKLEEVITVAGDTSGDKNQSTGKPRKLLLYEKKFLLNLNAEFLAEVERSDRAMMNLYYKAKLCKKNIDSQWKRGRKIKPAYINRYVMNNRYEGSGVRLVDFDAYLTNKRVNTILTEHHQFMYGGGRWGGGARVCLNKLMEPTTIFSVSYRDIKECSTLEEQMGQVEESIIENHCMPRLFAKWRTPKEISELTTD